MVTAGIYARISSDPDGTRLGVERQIADCEALAARLGWTVSDQYIDNDLSAWSGKARPEYQRMVDDLKNREIDAVLVWHPDRLTRHPKEVEELIALVEGIGDVRVETVTAGDYDLSTSAGRSVARIVGEMRMPPMARLVQLGNPQIRERVATQATTHPTEEPPDIRTQRPRVVLTFTAVGQGVETVEAVRSAIPSHLRPSPTGRLIDRAFRVVLPTIAAAV